MKTAHIVWNVERFPEKQQQNIRKQKKKYVLIAENVIEMSDIILEILDSRFPEKTKNPEITSIIKKQNKRIIYVLNKSDLVKKKIAPTFFPFVFVSCKNIFS